MSDILPEALPNAIDRICTDYLSASLSGLDAASKRAVETMTQLTKAAAPFSAFRHKKGRSHFRASIDFCRNDSAPGTVSYTWYVKRPNYRLTHLLEHGHRTRTGGIVAGRNFVQNAFDSVIASYQSDVEAALKG